MKAEAARSTLSGSVTTPSSKSAMQRYIAGALLAEGLSTIKAASLCDDSLAALSVAETLGAHIEKDGDVFRITGGFKPSGREIFCGESGLSARMFTPVASLHDRELILTGKGSLLKRPFEMAEPPLRQLGVTISSNGGFLPLKIKGPLTGGNVTADGSLSSQFITGLLTALPVAPGNSILTADRLASRPYVELTLKILGEFGVIIENNDFRNFIIRGGQHFRPGNFEVEGDWSGAAFLLVMAAIGGKAEVNGLNPESVQADRAVLKALASAGADVNVSGSRIAVSGGALRSFEFDISDCPDLGPPLAVLALACHGKSILRGTERLAAKESNRGIALEKTLRSVGGRITNFGTYIEIEGGKIINGGAADSFNDHRIAMALAAAALISKNPVTISGIECINKSYPEFIEHYRVLGGKIIVT